MKNLGIFLACFWRDEGGSVGSEYAVLLIIVALGMAVSAGFLAGAISSSIETAADCLNARAACAP